MVRLAVLLLHQFDHAFHLGGAYTEESELLTGYSQ